MTLDALGCTDINTYIHTLVSIGHQSSQQGFCPRLPPQICDPSLRKKALELATKLHMLNFCEGLWQTCTARFWFTNRFRFNLLKLNSNEPNLCTKERICTELNLKYNRNDLSLKEFISYTSTYSWVCSFGWINLNWIVVKKTKKARRINSIHSLVMARLT